MRVAYHELVAMRDAHQCGLEPNEIVTTKDLMGRILEDLAELDQLEQELSKLSEEDVERFKDQLAREFTHATLDSFRARHPQRHGEAEKEEDGGGDMERGGGE